MVKPNAPCEKHGVACPRRQVGCRRDCDEWKRFEQAQAEHYKERDEEIRKTRAIGNYRFDGITRRLRENERNKRR